MSNSNPEIDKVVSQAEKSGNASLAVLASNIGYIFTDVKEIKEKLENNYSTKEYVDSRFDKLDARVKMLEKVVYTVIGLILIAFMGALIGGVIHK
jgi:hypothetical protein